MHCTVQGTKRILSYISNTGLFYKQPLSTSAVHYVTVQFMFTQLLYVTPLTIRRNEWCSPHTSHLQAWSINKSLGTQQSSTSQVNKHCRFIWFAIVTLTKSMGKGHVSNTGKSATFPRPGNYSQVTNKTKLNSVALVRERTIPTERPPPVGEVSANFCG